MFGKKIFALVFTGSIASSAKRRHLSYSEADFEVFVPQTRHVAPIRVKFGQKEGTESRISPLGVTIKVFGPQKLNFFC